MFARRRSLLPFLFALLFALPLNGLGVSSTGVAAATTCPNGQWQAEYFPNLGLQRAAQVTRCEAQVSQDWRGQRPATGIGPDNFSVRWSSQQTFPGGDVTFTLLGDDGVRLFLDGAQIINGWRDQPAATYRATRTVPAGTHTVRVEYYQAADDATVRLTWQAAGPVAGNPPAQSASPWVSDRGIVFGLPYDGDWSRVGAYLGLAAYTDTFGAMAPNSIKTAHGEFHVVNREADDGIWPYLSYSRLQQLDQQERAAGRAPILMTATYNGTSYPLYWGWSVGFVPDGAPAGRYPAFWKQGINVASPAYIDYWVNEYARPKLYNANFANYWISLDECSFMRRIYGVVDNQGRYRSDVQWDAPFPQTEEAYQANIMAFFAGVKARMPELKLMCNDGGQDTAAEHAAIFQNIDGAAFEDMTPQLTTTGWYTRNEFAVLLDSQNDLVQRGKVLIDCTILNSWDDIPGRTQTAYAAYLLVAGANSFFCPMIDPDSGNLQNATVEIDPAHYAAMKNSLGPPIATFVREQRGESPGYSLYSRRTEGGIVYLNWSGGTVTVALPTDATYVDQHGNVVTSITLGDMGSGYVLRR